MSHPILGHGDHERGAAGAAAGAPTVSDAARERISEALTERLALAVDGLAPGSLVEVSLRVLRSARSRPESLGLPPPPFVWRPVFVRRSLGLAAVRACATGRFRGPAEAVGPVAEQAVDEWRRTGWRTFLWEPWFAGLGAGARAVVLAESVTWATPLWASADWAALGGRADVGGAAAALWTLPGVGAVRLKARWEARVRPAPFGSPTGGAERPSAGSALVSVSGGTPDEEWTHDLAYLALVAGLRRPDRPVAARVVGLWPEAGVRRTVRIDEEALDAAADLVVTVVARLAALAPSVRMATPV